MRFPRGLRLRHADCQRLTGAKSATKWRWTAAGAWHEWGVLLTSLDVLDRFKTARIVGLNLALFCLKSNAVPSII